MLYYYNSNCYLFTKEIRYYHALINMRYYYNLNCYLFTKLLFTKEIIGLKEKIY